MPIHVDCPSCRTALKVKDEFAGKRGKCPKCGKTVEIPNRAPAPTVAASEAKSREQKAPVPPATERQKEYARELGITFDDNVNRREISKLIDHAVRNRDDERFKKLDDLQDRESEAYREIRQELAREMDADDPRVSRATPDEIMTALADRGLGAVLITFDPDKLDDNLEGRGKAEISYTEDWMTEEDMRDFLSNLGLSISGVSDKLENLSDLLDDDD